MKIQDDPLLSAVLDAAAPMVHLYHDGFEAGVDFARQQTDQFRSIFGDPSIQPDPWYFSHSVRIYVKRFLTQKGLQIDDYRIDNLPNSGLRFISNDWDWRTRKSSKNGMPRLAQTRPIRAFCQSMLPGEFGKIGMWDLLESRHLWLLWHTTPANDEYLGVSVIYRLGENSANPTVIGRIDYPAKSNLFRSADTMKQDVAAVGDMELEETAELSAELDMELTFETEANEDKDNADDTEQTP